MTHEAHAKDELEIDLRNIYRILRIRVKMIMGTVGIGMALVVLYLLLVVPLYTATTELIIDPRRSIKAVGTLVPEIGMDSAAIESEVGIIKSSSVAHRVIGKLKLIDDPEFKKKSASLSLLSTISDLLGLTRTEPEPEAATASDGAALNSLTENFARKLQVHRTGLTHIIEISFTSRDPEKAAKIANQFAESYLLDQLEATFQATRRANDWLNERLAELRKKLQESEKAVELYRAKHNLVGAVGETPFQTQLKKLNEELILARVQTKEKLASVEQVQQVIKSKGSLTSIDVVAQTDVIQKLQGEMAKVVQREAELTTRFTPQHPKVLNVRAERHDLQGQIAQAAKRIGKNIKNEHEIARRRERSIEKSLQELKDKTKGARSSSIRLRELEREGAANRAIYESFLNRFKETSQQESLHTAESRVITMAVPPVSPSYPKKNLMVLIAFVGFSTVGASLAFLLDHLDNSLKVGEQVEKFLHVAHLGSIPKLGRSALKEKGQKISIERYIVTKPLSSYAESIRALKIGIQLSNIDAPPKVILVTSSLPNEGKTTIALNLAQHAAQAGVRTLLIDGDLRNPSLSRKLIREPGPGLIELLSHQVSLEQAIVRDKTGFEFLQTSNIAQNSGEILGSQSMKDMLKQVRQVYDLIIIDTSPVVPVIDARVLVEQVDSLVLVAEWDKTPREIIANAIKSLNAQSEKIAGVVLNKTDMKRMASYGKYGYGGYYKNYPHYYGTSE